LEEPKKKLKKRLHNNYSMQKTKMRSWTNLFNFTKVISARKQRCDLLESNYYHLHVWWHFAKWLTQRHNSELSYWLVLNTVPLMLNVKQGHVNNISNIFKQFDKGI